MSRYLITETKTHSAVFETANSFEAICKYGEEYNATGHEWNTVTTAEKIPESNEYGKINHLKFLADMEAEGNPVKKIWYELNHISDRLGQILIDEIDSFEKVTGELDDGFYEYPAQMVRDNVVNAIEDLHKEYSELFKVVK